MKTQKLLLFGLFALLFIIGCFGCITQNKVTRWLREHPTEAAGYCADEFPPDTTTRIIFDSVDTKAYEAAYWDMARYADSLFNQIEDSRNAFKPTPTQPCPPLVNLDSLRKAVDKEIRKRLTPCKDSIKVVETTVIDRARERQLLGEIEQLRKKLEDKDKTISERDKTNGEKDKKIKSLSKWPWLFWGLVALLVVYILLKLRLKLPI